MELDVLNQFFWALPIVVQDKIREYYELAKSPLVQTHMSDKLARYLARAAETSAMESDYLFSVLPQDDLSRLPQDLIVNSHDQETIMSRCDADAVKGLVSRLGFVTFTALKIAITRCDIDSVANIAAKNPSNMYIQRLAFARTLEQAASYFGDGSGMTSDDWYCVLHAARAGDLLYIVKKIGPLNMSLDMWVCAFDTCDVDDIIMLWNTCPLAMDPQILEIICKRQPNCAALALDHVESPSQLHIILRFIQDHLLVDVVSRLGHLFDYFAWYIALFRAVPSQLDQIYSSIKIVDARLDKLVQVRKSELSDLLHGSPQMSQIDVLIAALITARTDQLPLIVEWNDDWFTLDYSLERALLLDKFLSVDSVEILSLFDDIRTSEWYKIARTTFRPHIVPNKRIIRLTQHMPINGRLIDIISRAILDPTLVSNIVGECEGKIGGHVVLSLISCVRPGTIPEMIAKCPQRNDPEWQQTVLLSTRREFVPQIVEALAPLSESGLTIALLRVPPAQVLELVNLVKPQMDRFHVELALLRADASLVADILDKFDRVSMRARLLAIIRSSTSDKQRVWYWLSQRNPTHEESRLFL